MRFIRDIINEKTQAARKGDTTSLRYPVNLGPQDRVDGAQVAELMPEGIDNVSFDQPPLPDPIAQTIGTYGGDDPSAMTPEGQVDYAAISSALAVQHQAPPNEVPIETAPYVAQNPQSLQEHAPSDQNGARFFSSTPSHQMPSQRPVQNPIVDPELRTDDPTNKPAAPAYNPLEDTPDTLRGAPAETTLYQAASEHQNFQMLEDDPRAPVQDHVHAPAPFDAPTQTSTPQFNVELDPQPSAVSGTASPGRPPQAEMHSEVAQASRLNVDMEPLSAPVSAHKPVNGRGSKGRVKTRLLGFSAPQNPVHDPMSQSREAASTPVSATHVEFPVGWLVVVDGPGKGASYSLFDGLTQIGRGEDQTVRLNFGDNTISRQNHAAIAFDGEQRRFFFGHGGKANLVRLNGRPVLSTEVLEPNSVIRIGETTLRFVALCGDAFSWDNAETAETGRANLG